MSPDPLSEITYITATPSQAIAQLNQFVKKQAKQQNQPHKSAFRQPTRQVLSFIGLFRVIWYTLFLEEKRLF